MDEVTISICSIADKGAVTNTDVIVELTMSTINCSINFSTVIDKQAFNDADIALIHKNSSTHMNGYDVWCGIIVKDVQATANTIQEKGALHNREINSYNVKYCTTTILSLKSRIFYCEIPYW